MPLFIRFFESQMQEVPDALTLQRNNYILVLAGVLGISFLLFSFARMSNNRIIQVVTASFFKDFSTEQFLKENMRINSAGSVLLIINYVISFSTVLFLALERVVQIPSLIALFVAFSFPLISLLPEFINLWLIGRISGEQKSIAPVILNNLTSNQFTGIVYFLLGLFWIMNPKHNEVFVWVLTGAFCLKTLVRLFKSSRLLLSNGIAWYYLILYFCTLEILPLVAVYILLTKEFSMKINM